MSRPAWPWKKLEARIGTPSEAFPAVLFATGSFSPTHVGHVLMMRQAAARLERLGYEVIGAWLSPSHDLSVIGDAKARGAPELRSNFRLRLAELSTQEDDLIDVSSWATSQKKVTTDYEVACALHQAVNQEYSGRFSSQFIRIFCVCGCDHFSQFRLGKAFGSTEMGVIVVPRDQTEEILLENHSFLVYVAETCPGQAAALSSTKVRKAIQDRDQDYVRDSMQPHGARCVLQPTLQELQDHRKDFENLDIINPALDIIAQDGPWPLDKLQQRVADLVDADHPAVIVVSGSMSPAHRGFFEVMKSARERLERAGYKVIGAYLSPQNATGGAMEMRAAAGSEEETSLSTGFRLKTTRLATTEDDFTSLSAWEASVVGRVPTPEEVMRELENHIKDNVPKLRQFGLPLSIFYAAGPGQAARRGLNKSVGMANKGVIIVPCEGEDCFMLEKPSNLFYVADPRCGEANIVIASKIRQAIKSGDAQYVRSVCHNAVSRFLLNPTEEERQTMRADFEYLYPATKSSSAAALIGIGEPLSSEDAREKFKSVLRAWAGAPGEIAVEDIARVLEVLDPSWTNSELNTFTSGAFGAVSKAGKIKSDDLVDWMFNQ